MDWISVEEASRVSGYNPQHIRRLIRSKQLLAEKKGLMWWIDRISLMALLEAAKNSPDSRRGPHTRVKSR
jgi:hypothetical protein